MNATRLALYYAAYFAVIGILLPFWPIWLEAKGLEASEIGVVPEIGAWAGFYSNRLVSEHLGLIRR